MRWWLPRIALAISSVFIFLVGSELLVRGWHWVAHGTQRVNGQPAGLYANLRGEAPRLKPGAELNGLMYSVRVNSDGFRGEELLQPKPRGGLRVWCVGGSTTFDIYAPDDAAAWPAQAEAALRRADPSRSIEVINAGVPGEILMGSTESLLQRGRPLGVDLVVVHHGPNDIRQLVDLPIIDHRPPPWFSAFELDIALRSWMQGRGLTAQRFAAQPFTRAHADELRQRLNRLLRAIARVGARPVFATHAARFGATTTGQALRAEVGELSAQWSMPPEDVRETLNGYNAVVTQLANDWNVPLADLRAVVPSEPRFWADASHFAAPGSALAGEEVARAIQQALDPNRAAPAGVQGSR